MFKIITKISNHIKISFALIALGLFFAFTNTLNIRFVYRFWPLIISFWGIGFIRIFALRPRREAIFLGIGSYLILFSSAALYLNFQGWHKLEYLWPIFIAFTGLSFIIIFFFKRQHKMYLLLGLILSSIAAVFFIVFSFELQIWWVSFILLGISILITGKLN